MNPPPSRPPAWMRELAMALPIYPQILLVGNVRDDYYLPSQATPGNVAVHRLGEVVRQLCAQHGYAALASHDIVNDHTTVTRLRPEIPLPPSLGSSPQEQAAGGLDFARLRQILTELATNETQPPTALLVEFAGRLSAPGQRQPEPARLFFAAAEALAHRARPPIVGAGTGGQEHPHDTVLWVTERVEDLPASFAADNPRLRVITIPHPNGQTRLLAAQRAIGIITARNPHPATTETERAHAAERLTQATHGMRSFEVATIGQLAADQHIGLGQIEDAARLYRIGISDNPWRDPQVLKRIRSGEDHLNTRVRGQRAAVRKTMDIFMRSATGLTGAHASSTPNRPRGVLFLAGPTGVGKTELAKGIAELILGTDAQPIRFDMSEFAAEHARDRLIGAPPGYAGFDAGGELTNAVRANPISVLLFDEIDKANPRIFDLFLQILEDGRLTDGHGSVVHFTECVLVFTSNLGVVGPQGRLSHTDDPTQVRARLRQAFEEFFNERIGRPELLNRFGDSFVALDFITPTVATEILQTMLQRVNDRLLDLYHCPLRLAEAAHHTLTQQVSTNLDNGGRGIGTVVETRLVDPLARALFAHPPTPPHPITVTDITHDGVGWKVHL